MRIELRPAEHYVEFLLEHFVDSRLHEHGALMRLAQIKAHHRVKPSLEQAVPPDNPQGTVEPIGGQLGSLVGLKAHELPDGEVFEHAARSRGADSDTLREVARVGLLAVICEQEERVQVRVHRSR